MAGSTLPPVSAATAGVLKRLGEEMAEAGDPQLAAHLRIGQVTAIDPATITATVAYGAGSNLVAIAGHHWLIGAEPAVNDYVQVLSQDGDNWIVGVMATAMAAPAASTYGALVTRTSDGTSFFGASVDTDVVWQSEIRDDGDLWTSGANTRLTLPVTGWWSVGGQIHYSGNVSGDTHFRFATSIRLNGTTNIARTQPWCSISDEEYVWQVHAGKRYFTAGDYVTLRGFQDTPSAMSILTSLGAASNHFYAFYEGA